MKEDLFEMLKQLKADLSMEEERPKVQVGELDDELIQQYKKMRHTKQVIMDEIEVKAKELQLRFDREFQALVEPMEDEMEKIHDAFWERVCSKLNLDPNDDLNVEPKERKVYRYVQDSPQNNVSSRIMH